MRLRVLTLVLVVVGGASVGATEVGRGKDDAAARPPAERPAPDPVTVAIAELLTGREPLVVEGQRLDVRALRQLYEPRGYRPVWVAASDGAERSADVSAALARTAAHGLDPAAYHERALARRAAGRRPEDRAAFEMLASDGLMRLASHLRVGAVGPGAVDKDAAVAARPVDQQALVLECAAASDVPACFDGLAPQTETYRGLMDALARYREIERAGGWPTLAAKGPALEPGATDPAIEVVRARLAATGALGRAEAAPDQPAVYDAALEASVKDFQLRHGLAPDGVIGAGTRAALAVPVGERIKQLVVNLERARWFPPELGRHYVAVNVPSFELVVVEDGSRVLSMPVVVGRKDRPTPLLSTQITQLIFNPSWTVPPTILRADFLPKMRRNQSYAARRGLQVVGSKSPTLRQPPGPRNPLGRVKFLMPNTFSVYLHDTTAKGLMRQPRRALSSGCVRLGDAMGLANHLLADDPRWTVATRKRFLSGWTTRYLSLREPVPVYLRYQTAWRDDDGDVQFRDDLYGRDAALAKALGQELTVATVGGPSA
jgi:murein L,D-transpeptidase YcbB/YkuD